MSRVSQAFRRAARWHRAAALLYLGSAGAWILGAVLILAACTGDALVACCMGGGLDAAGWWCGHLGRRHGAAADVAFSLLRGVR